MKYITIGGQISASAISLGCMRMADESKEKVKIKEKKGF